MREDSIRDYNSTMEFAGKDMENILDAMRRMGIDEATVRAVEEAVIQVR